MSDTESAKNAAIEHATAEGEVVEAMSGATTKAAELVQGLKPLIEARVEEAQHAALNEIEGGIESQSIRGATGIYAAAGDRLTRQVDEANADRNLSHAGQQAAVAAATQEATERLEAEEQRIAGLAESAAARCRPARRPMTPAHVAPVAALRLQAMETARPITTITNMAELLGDVLSGELSSTETYDRTHLLRECADALERYVTSPPKHWKGYVGIGGQILNATRQYLDVYEGRVREQVATEWAGKVKAEARWLTSEVRNRGWDDALTVGAPTLAPKSKQVKS